jgi:hypothetical protein
MDQDRQEKKKLAWISYDMQPSTDTQGASEAGR